MMHVSGRSGKRASHRLFHKSCETTPPVAKQPLKKRLMGRLFPYLPGVCPLSVCIIVLTAWWSTYVLQIRLRQISKEFARSHVTTACLRSSHPFSGSQKRSRTQLMTRRTGYPRKGIFFAIRFFHNLFREMTVITLLVVCSLCCAY